MDDAAIYRQEAEIRLLPLQNESLFSGVTYPFALNPIWGLAFRVSRDDNINNNNNNSLFQLNSFYTISTLRLFKFRYEMFAYQMFRSI